MRKRPFLLLSSILGGVLAVAAGCSTSEPVGLCPEGQVRLNQACLYDLPIAINGVGYLPQRSKKAVYQGESAAFEVINVTDGSVAMSGTAEGPTVAPDTEQEVYVADFTSLTEEGEYYVEADGQRSGNFKIGPSALDEALDAAMLGMYGMRCGVEVSFEYKGDTFRHSAGHLAKALMTRINGDPPKDDTGGWHDAGDYGKYVRNGAFSVAFLMKAYEHFPTQMTARAFEIPETGDGTPDMLDEARVELEWILKTQLADGSFAHKVTGDGFEGNVMPASDRHDRFFYSKSTTSTGDAVAVLAMAGRLYTEFDATFAEKCLAAAKVGQGFLDANPENIECVQEGTDEGGTGNYSGGDGGKSERLWALAELWETTGEQIYLDEFEATADAVKIVTNMSWDTPGNLAILTYLDSEREGRDQQIIETKTRRLIEQADKITDRALNDEFGRGLEWYYWGSNGVTALMSYVLAGAHRVYPNTDYLDAITAQVDHLLGRNGFARSFVTGLGTNPVLYPHHRPSFADPVSAPWPGLLIGGPHTQGGPISEGPPGLAWEDDSDNYYNNEVAINWNVALIYALVAADATSEDESAECAPNCLPEVPAAGGAGGMN